MALIGSAPEISDGSTDTSSWQSNVGTILALGVWGGGFVHALAINRSWLRFKADADSSPWSSAGSNGAASAVPAWGTAGTVGPPGATNQYSSQSHLPHPPTPVSTPPPAPPPPVPNVGGAEAAEGPSSHDDQEPIDVNTATLADFLGRGGFGLEVAERAIVARQHYGGFWSIEEFVTAAQLPPQLYDKVRDLLTVGTLPRKRQPGRPDGPNRQGGDGKPDLDR